MRYWQSVLTTSLLLIAGLAHAGCDERATPGMFVFPSDAAASSFLSQLKVAVSSNDTTQAAQLIMFPLRVDVHGKRMRVSRSTFPKYFSAIFNSKVRSALASAEFRSQSDHACVFWNASGMMVGNGEIWFNSVKDGIKVIAVNN
jgi:hypothetical protein